VVNFAGLSVNTAGTYTLTLSAAGSVSVNSTSFKVTAGAATALDYVTQPNNVNAGTDINPVTVEAVDTFGNPVSGVSVAVIGTPTALTTGTTPLVTNAAGEVVFSNLSETTAGNEQLQVSAAGVPNLLSSAFTVSALAASKLSFFTEPASTNSGSLLTPVTVLAADKYGNPVAGVSVKMGISASTLNGTTTIVSNPAW